MRIASLLAASTLLAQTPAPVEFAVSTIRPNKTVSESSRIRLHPEGMVEASNITLMRMIVGAYDVTEAQVADAPAWVKQDRWDLTAKTESPQTNLQPDQASRMLRTLLEDRFKLKVRREHREMPVYRIIVDRGGVKMKPAAEPGLDSASTRGGPNGMQIEAKRMRMPRLAQMLSRYADRPVIDRTELTGAYDFTLEWAPETASAEAAGASLFTSVREQLGLRLEAVRDQVEVLAIERVEQPDEN
jgi:uncharacterized protein (TIGR03435 family)